MQRTSQRQFSQMSEYAISSNGSDSPTAFCLPLDGLRAYQLLAGVPDTESWPPGGCESRKRRLAASSERRSERQPKSMTSSVARRNERERNRIKQVNLGFERLRQHVPNGDKNKKMSKVETLRAAVDYINQLQAMLTGSELGSDALQIDTWAMLESAKALLPAAACSSSDSDTDRSADVGMTSSCHSNGSSPSSRCGYSTDVSASLTSTSLSLDEALTDITNWFQ